MLKVLQLKVLNTEKTPCYFTIIYYVVGLLLFMH